MKTEKDIEIKFLKEKIKELEIENETLRKEKKMSPLQKEEKQYHDLLKYFENYNSDEFSKKTFQNFLKDMNSSELLNSILVKSMYKGDNDERYGLIKARMSELKIDFSDMTLNKVKNNSKICKQAALDIKKINKSIFYKVVKRYHERKLDKNFEGPMLLLFFTFVFSSIASGISTESLMFGILTFSSVFPLGWGMYKIYHIKLLPKTLKKFELEYEDLSLKDRYSDKLLTYDS